MTVNREQREQVDSFKYLNSWITLDERSDMDIICKIGQAKKAFVDVRNVRLGIKKRLLMCYIWSVLLQ